MNLLHITPEAPGSFSGGAICVKQTLLSLSNNGYTVDYVGPEIEDREIRKRYRTTFILQPGHNQLLRAYDTLFMNTNQRYRSWLKLKLDYGNYDAVVMDFTKLHYVLKRVPLDKLIVRVHNVESDYSHNNYLHHKSLVNFLDHCFSGKRERQIVEKAARLVVLTQKDRKRLIELYHVPEEKMVIVPICIERSGAALTPVAATGVVRMILNGSLWFGPNYDGIRWFLESVYPKLTFPKHLIIAGSKPNEELVEMVRAKRDITLVDTPPSMQPYFEQSDLAIAPVFDGAGMKVKVAEALSYGLPVVGTSHAFVGYEIEDGKNSYRADTEEEFVEKLTKYEGLNLKERNCMRKKCFKLYKSLYDQKCSDQLMREILESVVG